MANISRKVAEGSIKTKQQIDSEAQEVKRVYKRIRNGIRYQCTLVNDEIIMSEQLAN
jgi:hypothetical protein